MQRYERGIYLWTHTLKHTRPHERLSLKPFCLRTRCCGHKVKQQQQKTTFTLAHTHIYMYIHKTETNKLQIIKISLNPKPHLETQRLPLVWVLPCQQCSMGNEEWVGVWPDDLSTTRLGPSINISLHSAPAQSIALIFTYTEGSCKTCVNWGRWKGNCIADGCCVSWTLNSLLTFWACYQFYMVIFVSERTRAYGLLVYIIFNLMVNAIDSVWKSTFLHLNRAVFCYYLTWWASH